MQMQKSYRRNRLPLVLVLMLVLLVPCMATADYGSKEIDKRMPKEAYEQIPPALQGKAFGLYYKGSAVELIKMRLQELGYYKRMSTFHDKFDKLLLQRLREFQYNNGLKAHGKVDETTLAVMYGEHTVKGKWYNGKEPEPEITLIIPVTKSAQWYLSAENEIGFRVTVKNVSDKRVITAYEVAMYALNDQGEKVYEVKNLPVSGKIGQAKTAWTPYVFIQNPDEIRSMHVALKRVRYDDGETVILEEPVYDCFVIREEAAPEKEQVRTGMPIESEEENLPEQV